MTLDELRTQVRTFAEERDWNQYHTPRNLVIALGAELGELMELFQWRTDVEVVDLMKDERGNRSVSDELADVLIYLVRLADVLDIDLAVSAQRKIEDNNRRYPVSRVRGSADKQP